jgi:hypothetical protein
MFRRGHSGPQAEKSAHSIPAAKNHNTFFGGGKSTSNALIFMVLKRSRDYA